MALLLDAGPYGAEALREIRLCDGIDHKHWHRSDHRTGHQQVPRRGDVRVYEAGQPDLPHIEVGTVDGDQGPVCSRSSG